MNPHFLFSLLSVLAALFMAMDLSAKGDLSAVQEMAAVVGLAGGCIGAFLLVTRKYWRNARRLI